MKITHNAEIMNEFTTIILANQIAKSKKRSGFHRSDVISCPLQCYWRMTGKEAIYGSETIGIFVIGILAHMALEQNFDAQEQQYKFEDLPPEDLQLLKDLFAPSGDDDIFVTIDAVNGKYPIECKTTRKPIYRREDIPNDWVEQLCFGMSIMGIKKGYLMILNVITFAIMVWEFQLEDNEITMFKTAFRAKIRQLLYSIKNQNSDMLEPKRMDCKWCPYRPMRKRTDWKGCHKYNPIEK